MEYNWDDDIPTETNQVILRIIIIFPKERKKTDRCKLKVYLKNLFCSFKRGKGKTMAPRVDKFGQSFSWTFLFDLSRELQTNDIFFLVVLQLELNGHRPRRIIVQNGQTDNQIIACRRLKWTFQIVVAACIGRCDRKRERNSGDDSTNFDIGYIGSDVWSFKQINKLVSTQVYPKLKTNQN